MAAPVKIAGFGFAFLGALGVLLVSVSMPYHEDAKSSQGHGESQKGSFSCAVAHQRCMSLSYTIFLQMTTSFPSSPAKTHRLRLIWTRSD
jgi:hypothetical protein